MSKANKNIDRTRGLLASMDAEFFGDTIADPDRPALPLDDRIYVKRILLDRVRPDPVQPRRILPAEVHDRFHTEQITPLHALNELVRLAKLAARQKGRPFENVMDILGNPDDDDAIDLNDLTPEEQLVYELVTLAISIRDDGQVNPITVIETEQSGYPIYRIETGERRYWASWLLADFFPAYSSDRMIDCVVIPPERYSPFRQARENSAREGLSAIALARQAALLVITVNGGKIPDQLVDHDFYRQALEMRIPREFAEDVYTAMGMKKHYFSYLKNLLRLSDEALELADRHHIEEKRLRYIVQLDADYHLEVVRQIIEFNLTAAQVKTICEEGLHSSEIEIIDEDMPVTPQAMQLAKALGKDLFAHDLARAIYKVSKNNRDMALAYAATMRRLAAEIENYI